MSIELVKNIIARFHERNPSVSVVDEELVHSFTDDPDFPYLVSFPRTGSHWLRMIMELYFEKPSLVRAFYFKNATDFTCYHTHDIDLDIRRANVIYLYRNPAETVYSQLNYYKEDLDDESRRKYWTELYACHLSKWLLHDDFTKKKTVITYEGMKSDMNEVMRKICRHFDREFNQENLAQAEMKVSKENLKKKTKHDKQVVNLSGTYTRERDNFKKIYGESIIRDLYSIDANIEQLFVELGNR